jgi:cytochrome P450
LRPAVQQIVDEQIDALLAGPRPVDLVDAFALPVPSLVICELLGVPYDDHDFFQDNSKVIIRRDTDPEERAQVTALWSVTWMACWARRSPSRVTTCCPGWRSASKAAS